MSLNTPKDIAIVEGINTPKVDVDIAIVEGSKWRPSRKCEGANK